MTTSGQGAIQVIRRQLWTAQRTDILDILQTLIYDFEHLHELAEAAHAVNDDHSDEGAWMFLSGECLDYESPGVPELTERLAVALRLYGELCAQAERARCAQEADYYSNNSLTARSIAKAIRALR